MTEAEDPLALDPESMRRMGYEVVDLLVDRIATLRDGPALLTAPRSAMAERIDEPAPVEGRDFATLLERLDRDVLPFVGHFDHPRFFGYIPGAGTWPAALGDLIAAATNIDAGAWRESAGPSQLELTVLEWFRQWMGYPAGAAGVLVSGGSAANLTAIACAREAVIGPMSPRIVAYTSDQTHSSLARAARHLGFRPDQIRVLPSDDRYRLRPDDLEAAIEADVAAGRLPFLVSANAGTTNTGAVDDLVEISRVARSRGIWMHVDGAYGGFAVLTERGREALTGLALADSVTLDPHKWLAMPFEVGCLMVRDGGTLERAFELHPEYLQEHPTGPSAVNFADRGLQLTRASRAIKVWLAIQTFGVDAFRAVIDRAMDLAIGAQRAIEADDRLELVSPASLGILSFRRRGKADDEPDAVDRWNEAIVGDIAATGDVLLTSTVIGGRYAIRLCVLNHTSTASDVAYALQRVAGARVAVAARTAAAPERASMQAGVNLAWLGSRGMSPDDLRTIAAFAEVPDESAVRFLAAGREEHHVAGRPITSRWEQGRTFYLVGRGRLSVRVDDHEVNVLGTGDHFGEIAAIDWGRDFSYGRTATVVPLEPTTVLAFPAAALRELMTDCPPVDRAIRRIAQARLARR
ncbi:MAG TPA: aminotransferase class I/II-fold pyridoxal phosphate-dependent enzyme [Candidatus Limnocylindrales bacterium]|nr:aminotransferase class I/II-fold pyridoxal phosphate-dependent enzyme [Candidatus Limnocylindrales bacterium]